MNSTSNALNEEHGHVRLATSGDIVYRAYSRPYGAGSGQVITLLASCSYGTGGWEIRFVGDGSKGYKLMEHVPAIVNQLATYYSTSFTSGIGLLDAPSTVAITDGRGTHQVPVLPMTSPTHDLDSPSPEPAMLTSHAPTTSHNIGLYPVDLIVGEEGTPGAPILHLSLLVNATNGKVAGHARITQSVAPPLGDVEVSNVTGQIHGAGLGGVTRLLSLQGEAYISAPPPIILTYTEKFTASIAVNNDWTGEGGWARGPQEVDHVPVKKG